MIRFSKKLTVAVLFFGFLACPLAAQAELVPSFLPDKQEPAKPYDRTLAAAPDDAWLVVYADKAGTFVDSPLGEIVGNSDAAAASLLSLARRSFDGATMLAVSGMPANPFGWRYTMAAETKLPTDAWLSRLKDEVEQFRLAMERSNPVAQVQFEVTDATARLTVVGPVSFSMSIAGKDGQVYGSTTPGATDAWLAGQQAAGSFVTGEAFTECTEGHAAKLHGLLYVDLQGLAPLMSMSVNQAVPNLYESLQLDYLKYAALLIREDPNYAQNPPPSARPASSPQRDKMAAQATPKQPKQVRLVAGLKALDAGLWHLLASTPGRATLDRAFPVGTNVFVHGSMDRASTLMDDVMAFAGRVDQVILEEYRTEVAEFKRDVGFDPHTMFLGNFVDEWAYGLSAPDFESAVLIFRLADPRLFSKHERELRHHFKLEVHPRRYRGVVYTHADRKAGGFYYAQYDDLLIVSAHETAVTASLDALLDDASLATSGVFKAIREVTPQVASKFVFAHVGELVRLAIEEEGETGECPPELRSLVEAGAGVAMTVSPLERHGIAVDFVAVGEGCPDPWEQVQRILTTSLSASRAQAKRMQSRHAVKMICAAAHIYDSEHKDAPKTLEQIIATGHLGSAESAEAMLKGPYGDMPGWQGGRFYLYRYAGPLNKLDAIEPIVCEGVIHDGGLVVGFADGHTEWMTSPRAEEILALLKAEGQ